MSNFTRVYFPGLGIDFDLPSVAFTIGSYDIHFYGIGIERMEGTKQVTVGTKINTVVFRYSSK